MAGTLTVRFTENGSVVQKSDFTFSAQINGGNVMEGQTTPFSVDGQYLGSSFSYRIFNIASSDSSYVYTGESAISGTVTGDNVTVDLAMAQLRPPSVPVVDILSRTWNSVTAKASVSSFGVPDNVKTLIMYLYIRNPYPPHHLTTLDMVLYQGILETPDCTFNGNPLTSGYSDYTPMMVGCKKLYFDSDAVNGQDNTFSEELPFYLAPYPLSVLNVTSQDDSSIIDGVSVTIDIQGAAADGIHNETGALVNTEYRYSIDGGDTFSEWVSASIAVSPSTNVSATFDVPYNTEVTVQARQVVPDDLNAISQVKEIVFTSMDSAPFYTRISDEWRKSKPYVRHNGEWVKAKPYVYENGEWKKAKS